MKHDRTKMPPDELMCKVVAKWKGWGEAFYEENDYPDPDAFVQDPEWYLNEEYKGTYPGQPDPRSDTDAALELLHWLVNQSPYGRLDCVIAGWHLSMADENDTREHIPTSGEPFCCAVCWLARDVLGVDDESE